MNHVYSALRALKITDNQFTFSDFPKKILITFLTTKMETVTDEEDMDVLIKWIPNCDRLFLDLIAKEMMAHDLTSKHKFYLNNLVRIYGFSQINSKCLESKQNTCSAYITKQATKLSSLIVSSWQKSGLIASAPELFVVSHPEPQKKAKKLN